MAMDPTGVLAFNLAGWVPRMVETLPGHLERSAHGHHFVIVELRKIEEKNNMSSFHFTSLLVDGQLSRDYFILPNGQVVQDAW
jgi:hypothetical protein